MSEALRWGILFCRGRRGSGRDPLLFPLKASPDDDFGVDAPVVNVGTVWFLPLERGVGSLSAWLGPGAKSVAAPSI
jgi:hypothetical protein